MSSNFDDLFSGMKKEDDIEKEKARDLKISQQDEKTKQLSAANLFYDCQFVYQKQAVGCHVTNQNFQNIIKIATYMMTFQDFGQFRNVFLESRNVGFGVLHQFQMTKNHKTPIDLLFVDYCHISCDDRLVF